MVVNDSVFQSSNPMRHATTLLKQIQKLQDKPKFVLKFSDGGTDHRTNLEHVKVSAICLFKELDLDLYVAARCAPGQSCRKGHVYIEYRTSELCFVKRERVNRTGKNTF